MNGVRRISFPYLDDPVKLDVVQADVITNPIFRLAVETHVKPLGLAASLGRLDQSNTAEHALMRAYVEAIVTGSPTHPERSRDEWYQWFKDHPEEFTSVRGVCDVAANFEDDDGQQGPPPAGAPIT